MIIKATVAFSRKLLSWKILILTLKTPGNAQKNAYEKKWEPCHIKVMSKQLFLC